MIHPDDEQAVGRLLGTVPEKVRQECELRTLMYHRAGASGPLGALAIVDLLRYLNLAPQRAQEVQGAIDWRKFPQDGSVHVEALFFGSWMPGVFRGFVEAGTLDIQMDDEGVHKECRPDMVRLVHDYKERLERAQLPEEEKPDARAALLDVTAPADKVETSEPYKTVTDTVSVESPDDGPAEDAEFVWNAPFVKKNDPVFVRLPDGSDAPGKFKISNKKGNRAMVELNSTRRTLWYDGKDITYAGLVQQGG